MHLRTLCSGLAAGLRRESGRTLIELLVAMAIASMVSIALASIVILGLRFANHDRYEDQRIYPVRNGFDMIVKDVRGAHGAYADCPSSSGRTALAIRQPDGTLGYITYHLDSATRRIVRTVYQNHNCQGSTTTTNVAYQISYFRLTAGANGRFDIEMRAQSTNGEEFQLTQQVTGRVLGQP